MNPVRALQEDGQAVRLDFLSRGFRSRRDHTFAEKILSAMYNGFGQHIEPKA
jgi:6-phosphogluconate dehydrogenase (decarboxylating)